MISPRRAWVLVLVVGALWIACGGNGAKLTTGLTSGGDGGADSTTQGSSPVREGGQAGADSAASDGAPSSSGASQASDSSATPDGAGVAVGASVLEHHLHPTRDGFYVDPTVTAAAAETVHLDTTFTAKMCIRDSPRSSCPEGAEGGSPWATSKPSWCRSLP